ncbi:DUF4153 domain-containing protein [Reichenbachiella agariperforans]|uniref:DUF4153 domain-containing protein n=1 Tax=Reichenbachiella agariperforans TaxID=156994 RepID=UPI001C081D8D|nr:DUF4153 domain-containing protein [Reichenbachiella agariperforans]MBU2914701.1 DUF4153 domain-containing protein [Reichenbachiella agariperforans]
MRLPSLLYLKQKAFEGFHNFPFTILAAIAGSSIAIYLTEYEHDIDNLFPYINGLLIFALAIPLFFSVSIMIRHLQLDRVLSATVWVVSSILLLIIYLTLPDRDTTLNTSLPYIRYAIFNIIIHLLVSFAPYLGRNRLNGFWNYNQLLFVRLVTSLLYAGFLYVGLCLALVALDVLFDVDIPSIRYFELYILVQGVFNTWFFVSGIPKDLNHLDNITVYPSGLKIFTQFVLMPLLVLYLMILYVYGLKIVITWDWPEGVVAYLIICVAVLGIFNLLLMHPFSKNTANNWISKFSKIYYVALIPLVGLLFVAISIRIGDYGVTINRYLIVLLGIWLSLVIIYFVSGRENIKLIPISLACILILCSFGPWGIFSWSQRSQVQRLEQYLVSNGVLLDGKIQREVIWDLDSLPKFSSPNLNTNTLPDSVHNEVLSIVEYLDDYHGMQALRPWYTQNIDSLIRQSESKSSRYSLYEGDTYLKTAGIKPIYQRYSDYTYYEYSRNKKESFVSKNFEYALAIESNFFDETSMTREVTLNGRAIAVTLNPQSRVLQVTFDNETLTIPLSDKLIHLEETYGTNEQNLSTTEMQLTFHGEKHEVKLIIEQLRMNGLPDKVDISYVDMLLFFRDI